MQDDTTTQISLKSNRSLLIKHLVFWGAILAVVIVVAFVLFICGKRDGALVLMAAFGVFFVLIALAILILKFYKRKWYEFSESEIICYKRKKIIDTINVTDILQMSCEIVNLKNATPAVLEMIVKGETDYTFDIQIILRDNTQKRLGSFSAKDIQMLKEKLYGDLLSVNSAI